MHAMMLFCIELIVLVPIQVNTTDQLKRADALAGVWVSHLSTHVR